MVPAKEMNHCDHCDKILFVNSLKSCKLSSSVTFQYIHVDVEFNTIPRDFVCCIRLKDCFQTQPRLHVTQAMDGTIITPV